MTDSTAPTRTVRFAGETMMAVPLIDPLDVDGETVAEIRVAKLSVGAYRQHTDAGGKSDVLALPMFFLGSGSAVPDDVMQGLSFRDGQNLTEVASGFLNPPPKAGEQVPASA